MNVLFNGHYGCDSAGDDAALDAMVGLIERAAGSRPDVEVLSRHPSEDFDRAFGVRSRHNLEYATKGESAGRWLRGFNYGDDPEPLLALAERMEWADLLVLGAGNFINDTSYGLFRGMLARFAVSAFVARSVGTPCMLYGLSATPLSDPLAKFTAEWLFANADAVTFRESRSLETLRDQGIRLPDGISVLPDPVVCSRASAPARAADILAAEGVPDSASGRRLMVSVRDFVHRGPDLHAAYLDRIADVVRRWVESGGDVVFVAQCTYESDQPHTDDRFIARQVLERAGDVPGTYLLEGKYPPWETEALYSQCDVALCTRLHASVFAAKQGVPVVGVAYEPKVAGFFDSIGASDAIVGIDTPAEQIVGRLEAAIAGGADQGIAERVAALQAEASRYADVALAVIR